MIEIEKESFDNQKNMGFSYQFKYIIIGDQGTGKTAFTQKFVSENFNNQKITFGCDFSYLHIKIDQNHFNSNMGYIWAGDIPFNYT